MLDESVIPQGEYCYTIDRILWHEGSTKLPSIKIDLCPYWKYRDIRNDEPYCTYCDMNGIDYDRWLIGDQCKVCGVKGDEWPE